MKKNSVFLTILIALCCFFASSAETKLMADIELDPLAKPTVNYSAIRVDKVIRADTIVLENDEKVKLIGLDAPVPPKKKPVSYDSYGFVIEERDPLTTLNERAFDFAQRLLEGKVVRLEFDARKKDNDLHTLAYVYLKDGTFVNAEILRQGFADLKIVPPNTKHADALRQAYQEARREKRGLQGE